MDIFTTCDRCGANVSVRIAEVGKTINQKPLYNAVAEKFITLHNNDIQECGKKVLCTKCWKRLEDFFNMKRPESLNSEDYEEDPKNKPIKVEKVTNKNHGKAGNFMPGITQNQVEWLFKNGDRSIVTLFTQTSGIGYSWVKLREILSNIYQIVTIDDLVYMPIPSVDCLIKKGLDEKTAYHYRKILIEHGIQPGKGMTKIISKLKKKNHKNMDFSDKSQFDIVDPEYIKRIKNKLINMELFDKRPGTGLLVGKLKQYGLQTVGDVIMYQPSRKELMAIDKYGEKYDDIFSNKMEELGIIEHIHDSWRYKMFYDEDTNTYYRRKETNHG